MKRRATDWFKVITKHIFDKVLYPEYIKNTQTSIIRKQYEGETFKMAEE